MCKCVHILICAESEVDDEVIDERPLDNNLMNHVTEPAANVDFSYEDGQKVRYNYKQC